MDANQWYNIKILLFTTILLGVVNIGINIFLWSSLPGVAPVALSRDPFQIASEKGNFTATFTGQHERKWTPAKGNIMALGNARFGSIRVAVFSSTKKSASSGGATGGVFVVLPKKFEDRFSGKMVKVTVIARRASENPAASFKISYSTNEVGNSGWRGFKPEKEFKKFQFNWKVPKPKKGKNDFLGIWADPSGKGKKIEVAGVIVELF